MDGGTVRLPRLIGLSRALDMILTGRPVGAEEALSWGLANRVVEDGTSRQEAEKLAAQIAEFPQICMRHDRMSSYEQFGLEVLEALRNEFCHGLEVVQSGETVAGATRFAKGAGRHGSGRARVPVLHLRAAAALPRPHGWLATDLLARWSAAGHLPGLAVAAIIEVFVTPLLVGLVNPS
jgi:hypothetical protein